MATVKRRTTGTGLHVPASLRSWDSPVWQDADLFRRWVAQNLPYAPLGLAAVPPGGRHRFAAVHWSIANGYTLPGTPSPDWAALAALDVLPLTAVDRCRRRVEPDWQGR